MQELYLNKPESSLWVLYDLRCPEACFHLHEQRATWQEGSDIEALDEDHLVLLIRPGIALWEAA
jgi:hypothetical protein